MIDVNCQDDLWGETFAPERDQNQPFKDWWEKHELKLGNLPKEVCEQWVYKHYKETGYKFLDLSKLKCKLESWSTDKIFKDIGIWDDPPIADKRHTYCNPNIYSDIRRNPEYEPYYNLRNKGTWNIPIIIMNSKTGFRMSSIQYPEVLFWLVEGHNRIRCLNAMSHHENEKLLKEHDVYVLNLD